MCKAKSEGGYRCPFSGGALPCPRGKAERAEYAAKTNQRRSINRQSASEYRERRREQIAEVEAWVETIPAGRREAAITARLVDPDDGGRRGHGGVRTALLAALECRSDAADSAA